MSSDAYADFVFRFRRTALLVRLARSGSDPETATVSAQGAVVLAAAALERYINDVLREATERIKVDSWDQLATGHKNLLTLQVATHLRGILQDFPQSGKVKDKRQGSLRKAVETCAGAFESPKSWPHFREYGLFLEAATEPDRLIAALRTFDLLERDFGSYVEEIGHDRRALFSSLTELIDARHAAAHALPDRMPPSPGDVQLWVIRSASLVRAIERFLGFRSK